MAVRRRLEAMNTALRPSLSPSAGAAVEAAVVLPDPPSNWPRWAPYPRFKTVPRFELGDPAAQEYLAAEGYVVIANVLSSDEVATGLSKFWDQLEKLNPGLVRSDSSTYGNWGNTTGWGHDEALWYIRGLPRVKKVWEHVYDTSELLVSFDGANIQRPWGLNVRKPVRESSQQSSL